jgi:hypothetical protein
MATSTRTRRARAGILAAGITGLALFAGACGGSAMAAKDPASSAPAKSDTHINTKSKGAAKNGGTQNGSLGNFSQEFAKCMRSNGVAKFPDPNGKGGQLGPNSGVDPASSTYQKALNGPCKTLAPPAWVQSGPGSARVGGQ